MGEPPPQGQAEWERLRTQLRLHQRLTGVVEWVPRSGTGGWGVNLGLPVSGFVDAGILTDDLSAWPEVGTVLEFQVWWFDDRPQIRLKPMDRRYLRTDFEAYLRRWRPDWIGGAEARSCPD